MESVKGYKFEDTSHSRHRHFALLRLTYSQASASLFIIFFSTVVWRSVVYQDGVWPYNYDAPYHVILVLKSWASVSSSEHHFLPLVSFGGMMDRFIPWGATLMSPTGLAYYLSFPPLGFVAPFLFHEALALTPSLSSLRWFNFGVHAGSATLIVYIAKNVVRLLPNDGRSLPLVVLLAGASYLLGRETMFAHGPSYWVHSIYELVLLGQILLFTHILLQGPRKWYLISGLLMLSILGPLTEWTGYITNAGIAMGLAVMAVRTDRRYYLIAAMVGFATIFAALLFALHVASVLEIKLVADYLYDRQQRRSGSWLPYWDWVLPALDASAALLPLGIGGFVVLIFAAVRHRINRAIGVILFTAAFPILENFLLLEHAISYHFDLAKLFVPLIVIMCIWLAISRYKILVACLWAIAIASNVALAAYLPRAIPTKDGTDIGVRMWAIVAPYNKSCAIITTSGVVRGYQNDLTNRSIYENILNVNEMVSLTHQRNACLGLWLTSTVAPTGWWDQAYIYDPALNELRLLDFNGKTSLLPR